MRGRPQRRPPSEPVSTPQVTQSNTHATFLESFFTLVNIFRIRANVWINIESTTLLSIFPKIKR